MAFTYYNGEYLSNGINDNVDSLTTTWSGTKIKNKFESIDVKISDIEANIRLILEQLSQNQ